MLGLSYIIDSLILAVALSLDAMIVSFSQGLVFKENRVKNSIIIAFFVGFFQFLFPIIGWFSASFIHSYISDIATFLASGIFIVLGLKIIVESFRKKNSTINVAFCKKASSLSLSFLLLISVATSIDALCVGVSFNLLNKPFLIPAIIIGIITFINSLIGYWSGFCFKTINTEKIEFIAGLILFLLGIKVLF